jgi:hypothetical protein
MGRIDSAAVYCRVHGFSYRVFRGKVRVALYE